MPNPYMVHKMSGMLCVQAVLEFLISVMCSLLWLTWCTTHLTSGSTIVSKSLAISLPSYVQGWICLMVLRLMGSRVSDKFCFSFYLMSGVRFLTSAASLFPQFTTDWWALLYGAIGLLCFIALVFHIVAQPTPETRQVKRTITAEGILEETPGVEMMTIQQLENYRDVVRCYLESHPKQEQDHSKKQEIHHVNFTMVRMDSLPSVVEDKKSLVSTSSMSTTAHPSSSVVLISHHRRPAKLEATNIGQCPNCKKRVTIAPEEDVVILSNSEDT